MDRLDLLYRRYRQIAGPPDAVWSSRTGRELRTWLHDDVMPAIHHLAKLSSFRIQASWPLEKLSRSANSEDRLLMNGVDKSIVVAARKLLKVLRSKAVRRGPGARTRGPRFARESVELHGDSVKISPRQIASFDRIQKVQASVAQIASRFWTDLVSDRDYFEPHAGWLTKAPSALQWGQFIVSSNPELHQGGDFISRCAIRRIEGLVRSIEGVHALVRAAYFESDRNGQPLSKARRESIEALRTACEQTRSLRHRLLEEEGQPLRDACILLTQVGAAIGSEFDVSWLAVPPDADRGVASMGHRLKSHENKEVFERIAAALACLHRHYAEQGGDKNAFDEAIAGQGLVIVRKAREAYWKGKKITTAWSKYPKEWLLLDRLAEKGRQGQWVGDDDPELYPDPPSASAIGTLCGRLKNDIPSDLGRLIVPGGPRRTYRLGLPRTQISVF